MKFTKATLLLLLLASLPACRFFTLNFAEPREVETKKTLFDQLIALAPSKQVPYPFAELIAYLAQYGEPVGVLVPLGLSQLRQAGYPEPFKDPRRIVAFGPPDPNNSTTQARYLDLFQQLGLPELQVGEFTIDSRLFLAYTQKTEQIEVMSLRPRGVEFDYQVVKNYRAASDPFVAAADKKHCRTCHQQDNLLTNAGLGNDSNATPMIARLIARHHPDGVLDGIPIVLASKLREELNKDQDNDTGGSISERLFGMMFAAAILPVDKLASSHGQAIDIIHDNQIWHDGCVHPKDKIACRKLMLQKGIFCQGMGLSNHISCVMDKQLKPKTIMRVHKFTSDFPNYLDNKPEVRQGFSLSAAGKQVLTNIKATKLGDLNPHVDKAEPGLYGLVSVFVEAGGGDVDFAMPIGIPPLSETDLAIIGDEVERLFIHVHRQDLHLNTKADPAYERTVNTRYDSALESFNLALDKTKDLFIQQTLLPANQQAQDMRVTNNPQIVINFDDSANTLQGTLTTFNFVIASDPPDNEPSIGKHWHKTAIKSKILQLETPQGITVPCQVAENTRQCEFKDLPMDTSGCDSCKTATLDITLRVKQDQQAKPPTSLATLKLDGKNYRFALLCVDNYYKKDHNSMYSYRCTLHDSWQIEAAFNKLVTDRHSPLYSDYFNPVGIVRHMLKSVGYEEPLLNND